MADLTIPVHDYKNKVSNIAIPVANTIADGDITTLIGAVDGMLVGNRGQATLDQEIKKNAGPGGSPANPKAQRELKWELNYHDSVTLTERQIEVPTSDVDLVTAGSDNMNLAAGAGLTLKTEFELSCIDPETGNAVILDSVTLTGRNL